MILTHSKIQMMTLFSYTSYAWLMNHVRCHGCCHIDFIYYCTDIVLAVCTCVKICISHFPKQYGDLPYLNVMSYSCHSTCSRLQMYTTCWLMIPCYYLYIKLVLHILPSSYIKPNDNTPSQERVCNHVSFKEGKSHHKQHTYYVTRSSVLLMFICTGVLPFANIITVDDLHDMIGCCKALQHIV